MSLNDYKPIRFHVTIRSELSEKTKRTTVSLQPFMCQLFCLKLGVDPSETEKAKSVITRWLQKKVDNKCLTPVRHHGGSVRLSQDLQEDVLRCLVSERLNKRWWHWWARDNAGDDYDPKNYDIPIIDDEEDDE